MYYINLYIIVIYNYIYLCNINYIFVRILSIPSQLTSVRRDLMVLSAVDQFVKFRYICWPCETWEWCRLVRSEQFSRGREAFTFNSGQAWFTEMFYLYIRITEDESRQCIFFSLLKTNKTPPSPFYWTSFTRRVVSVWGPPWVDVFREISSID